MALETKSKIDSAVKRLVDAAAIAIVLADDAGLAVIGSAHALRVGLEALGKAATIFYQPHDTRERVLAPWGFPSAEEPLREFIISFDLSTSPIKELRYERALNRLNIILSPSSGRLKREDVEFRYGPARYDLVCAIGIPSPELASSSTRELPELFHEKPILNLDANPANTKYGELNLIAGTDGLEDEKTIPGVIYKILEGLNALPTDSSASTALFAALAASTNNFYLASTSSVDHHRAASLLEHGADAKVAEETLKAKHTEGGLNLALLGRALARSHFEDRTHTLWCTITPDDFTKTKTNPDVINVVLERLSEFTPSNNRIVLLAQNENAESVTIHIYFADPAETTAFAKRTGATIRTAAIAEMPTASTFQEAEARATELLKLHDAVE